MNNDYREGDVISIDNENDTVIHLMDDRNVTLTMPIEVFNRLVGEDNEEE